MCIRDSDIARGVARLENTKTVLNISEKDVNWVEKKLNITYASSQKNAFNLLNSTGVKVLTGGPGTGKTTLINGILTLYKEKYPDNKMALCAPTGVAGEHMAESTNFPASTIHRLLEYQPVSYTHLFSRWYFRRNAGIICKVLAEVDFTDCSLSLIHI